MRRESRAILVTGVVALGAFGSVLAGEPAMITLADSQKALCAIYVQPEVMADLKRDKLVNPAREEEAQRQLLRESVKDLAHYLLAISGAEIPIITNALPGKGGTLPIMIGALAEQRFGKPGISAPFKQGLRVVADPAQGIGLYGESMLADSYAIYTFLDQLGCRWFFPSPLGEVIPQADTLRVPVQDLRDAPYTYFRGGSGYAFSDEFRRRNRMGGMMPPTQHCLEGYLSKDEKKAHPEWVAEYADGKPMPNRLKWSSREAAARIGEVICERQKTNPQFFYCLSPDDGAQFDESALDKALDTGDFDPTFQTTSLTDRALTFYNRIVERAVKEYPDLLFSALAYVQYTRPPLREKPHKNLVIQIAPITYSRVHPMNMAEVPDNEGLRQIVEGWGKVSPSISYYFYAYYLADPVSLCPFLRKWANDVPYIYEKGSCRYWQPETMGNFEFFAMAQWMGQRMAWNPKQDPWALYREVNDKLYGAAAEPMWAFWDAADRVWVDTPEYSGCGYGHLHRFTPERLANLRKLLGQAMAAAKTDVEKQRIALVKTSLDLTEDFVSLRRDMAEGRWQGLAERSAAWKAKVIASAKTSADQRCYAWCWFGTRTFGADYFDWFYNKSHASADRIATNSVQLLKQPVRQFRIAPDLELAGMKQDFEKPDFDDSKWREMDVCYRTWSSMDYHNLSGTMWYRTALDVQTVPAGKRIWLWIGATDGSVRVYLNGKATQGGREPGKPTEQVKLSDEPGGYATPLVFDVTDAIKSGRNSLAIMATRKVVNEIGVGGLLAPVTVFCDK